MKTIVFLFLMMTGQAFAQNSGIDYSKWVALSKAEKVDVMSFNHNYISAFLDGSVNSSIDAETLEKLNQAKSDLDLTLDDSYYGIIGEITKAARVYFSKEGRFIGATVNYFISGCNHFDKSGEVIEKHARYKDHEEALANQCVDNDVSWSAESYVDENFQEIEHSGQMEWSGY